MGPAVYEILGDPRGPGPFVFSCDHASNRLVEWSAEPRDAPLVAEHWGWDIGAADLTRALARRTTSCAVLSAFSRLVCDPNREPSEPSFVVERVDGHVLSFNRGIDPAERERRRRLYFDPYHDALDRSIAERLEQPPRPVLCAIHSFTPLFLGRRRPMEVGVLFDDHDEVAWRLAGALAEEGFETAQNAPYSGYEGLIYSASRHGRRHGLVYLELEVRQDLIETPERADRVAERIARALRYVQPASRPDAPART